MKSLCYDTAKDYCIEGHGKKWISAYVLHSAEEGLCKHSPYIGEITWSWMWINYRLYVEPLSRYFYWNTDKQL